MDEPQLAKSVDEVLWVQRQLLKAESRLTSYSRLDCCSVRKELTNLSSKLRVRASHFDSPIGMNDN